MSKELEALERIKREAGIPYFSSLYDIDMWKEDFATVETALKRLEQADNCIFTSKDDVRKEHQALEIIKDVLGCDGIVFDDDRQAIHIISVGEWTFVDKEEYDLLKEVLL